MNWRRSAARRGGINGMPHAARVPSRWQKLCGNRPFIRARATIEQRRSRRCTGAGLHLCLVAQSAVGRTLGPAVRRVFPILLSSVRGEIEKVVGGEEVVQAARERGIGVINAVSVAQEDA